MLQTNCHMRTAGNWLQVCTFHRLIISIYWLEDENTAGKPVQYLMMLLLFKTNKRKNNTSKYSIDTNSTGLCQQCLLRKTSLQQCGRGTVSNQYGPSFQKTPFIFMTGRAGDIIPWIHKITIIVLWENIYFPAGLSLY